MQLKPEIFKTLVATLSTLFFRREDIEAIVHAVGLDVSRISWDTVSSNTWASVIRDAEDENKVSELLAEAITRRPFNQELEDLAAIIKNDGYFDLSQIKLKVAKIQEDQPVKVLIASEKANASARKMLENHLAIYRLNGCIELIDLFSASGQVECHMVLLLISPAFWGAEYPYLLLAQQARDLNLKLVPVLVEECDWEKLRLIKNIVPLPKNKTFATDRRYWNNENEAFKAIALGIFEIARLFNRTRCE